VTYGSINYTIVHIFIPYGSFNYTKLKYEKDFVKYER